MLLQLLPFVVAGIASGAIYGLAGTGLVLTYKSSGIFNFGHGAIATVAAYVFYGLHSGLLEQVKITRADVYYLSYDQIRRISSTETRCQYQIAYFNRYILGDQIECNVSGH